MPSKQIRKILSQIREMHSALSSRFRSMHQASADPRLSLVVDDIAAHEAKIDQCLADYQSDAAQFILDTWIQFGNEEEIIKKIESVDFADSCKPEELVQTALDIQRDLVQLYRELSQATALPEVQELFDSLITLEENKGRHYSRMISEMMTG